MYEKLWKSPDQIITKEILEEGIFGSKPTDNSTCTIEITNINNFINLSSEYISETTTYPLNVTIGESNTPLDRQIEKCLTMMNKNELSLVNIKLPENEIEISFNIRVNNFTHAGNIYEWSAREKCEIAHRHKEHGIALFKENRFKDASHRFSRALKLMLSIPIPVDDIPAQVDGVALEEIYKLDANLYNNLASCYSKERRHDSVVQLCSKVLEIEPNEVKALYKRGSAYYETKDYENAYKDLMKLLEIDVDNKAAREKLKQVNFQLNQEEAKFNSIVKKMFRA